MRAVGETVGLAEVQDCEPAKAECLPWGYLANEAARRMWMRVEHFLAENPTRTAQYACAKLGIPKEEYETARKLMVGDAWTFGEADKIRDGDAITGGRRKPRRSRR